MCHITSKKSGRPPTRPQHVEDSKHCTQSDAPQRYREPAFQRQTQSSLPESRTRTWRSGRRKRWAEDALRLALKPYLRSNEHIVPADVLKTFLSIVNDRTSGRINGLYVPSNFQIPQAMHDKIQSALRGLGYSAGAASAYLNLLLQENTIAIAPHGKLSRIKHTLAHERFHQEYDKLTVTQRRYMDKAANAIREHRVKQEVELSHQLPPFEHLQYQLSMADAFIPELGGLPEETFAFMATGSPHDESETILRTRFPQAYRIYTSLRDRVQNLEDYDPKAPLPNFSNKYLD